jgi:hypothetical protein
VVLKFVRELVSCSGDSTVVGTRLERRGCSFSLAREIMRYEVEIRSLKSFSVGP